MARPSGVTAGEQQRQQQQHSDAEPAHAQLLRGLHFADPHGSWGDNALSLLSAQASLSADPASPRKHGSPAAATPRTGDNEAGCRVALDEAAQPQQPAQPCHSDGLTANTGSESPDGGTSAAPVNSGTGFAPPGGDPDGSSPPPVQQPGKKATKKRKKGRGGMYADLIGREVDVPASVFDIQILDLFYRAVVKRKDAAHAGAVVIRFPEDGSIFWLPADEVWGYIADMEARRGLGNKSLAGERCATYAAEVLVSLSGACSSCTQHSAGGGGSHVGSKVRRQSAEVISAMASPPRKRARV